MFKRTKRPPHGAQFDGADVRVARFLPGIKKKVAIENAITTLRDEVDFDVLAFRSAICFRKH